MPTEVLTVHEDGMMLDDLLFRRFRVEYAGFVEATLAANPGLADLGPMMPFGTKVTVTLPRPPSNKRTVQVRRLWN